MIELKCCWRCGRWGTHRYIESHKGDHIGRWECSNDRACAARAARADPATPA